VVDSDGDEIPSASGGFWMTTETFDPYHLVCDGLPETE
jgi:hypothetical protein